MLTLNHRIKDLYKNPVGKDVIDKLLLQMGYSEVLIKNHSGNIKLKALPKLTRGFVDDDFLNAILELLNSEPDTP